MLELDKSYKLGHFFQLFDLHLQPNNLFWLKEIADIVKCLTDGRIQLHLPGLNL